MKLGERICLYLNSFFSPTKVKGRESPLSYSEAQYHCAKSEFDKYRDYIDLKDKEVLDAGCGLGGKTIFYAENGCKLVIGIDVDEKHIENCKEFARKKNISNIEFQVGSLDNLPFESNRFDVIFFNDVIEHVRRPLLFDALKESRRILKKNGKICIEFPPWSSPYAAHLYDYIYIPWCQILFSTKTLTNVVQSMNPKIRNGQLSYVDHFLQLNRLTISEFKNYIKKLDFKIITFRAIMIKKIAIFKYIPYFNKYFTSRTDIILSK